MGICTPSVGRLQVSVVESRGGIRPVTIPAMSSEVERAFSGARNTIFEMTELEKQWMRAGLGDDLGPSGDLVGYLTPDGKAVLEKVLWGKEGRPKDLDEDIEPV